MRSSTALHNSGFGEPFFSNAIKFSGEGGQIDIEVFEESPASGGAALCCKITDGGPGIPDGELTAIFDSFVQSSKTKTGAGGTGLGLAICQMIVQAHGGRIWAENAKPKGAVFTFVIPKGVLRPALSYRMSRQ